uniref:Uncharacterized protein n=1 Tax=Arundo donax TaxID=35708 RepID=A0A0A8Z8A9_ARUDO
MRFGERIIVPNDMYCDCIEYLPTKNITMYCDCIEYLPIKNITKPTYRDIYTENNQNYTCKSSTQASRSK